MQESILLNSIKVLDFEENQCILVIRALVEPIDRNTLRRRKIPVIGKKLSSSRSNRLAENRRPWSQKIASRIGSWER